MGGVTTPAERKALNEGAFRAAHESLGQGSRELVGADDASVVPFLCECPSTDCMQVVLLTFAEYEEVRSAPRRGVAAPGHEDPSIERVLAGNDRFVMTEKFGLAGEVHAETDPRE